MYYFRESNIEFSAITRILSLVTYYALVDVCSAYHDLSSFSSPCDHGVQAESRSLTTNTVYYNPRAIQAPTQNTDKRSLISIANEKLAQRKLYELLV